MLFSPSDQAPDAAPARTATEAAQYDTAVSRAHWRTELREDRERAMAHVIRRERTRRPHLGA